MAFIEPMQCEKHSITDVIYADVNIIDNSYFVFIDYVQSQILNFYKSILNDWNQLNMLHTIFSSYII